MSTKDDLVARIEAIQGLAQQRKARQDQPQTQAEASPKASSEVVVRLPLWPDAARAVPNGFLRSALFGAIRKGRRSFLKGEQIAALDGIEIYYTGERLDQGDLDVWESILHAVRSQGLGSRCRVTSYTLLKHMGLTDTGKNRLMLLVRIERLRANAIRIRQGRYTFIGGMIDEGYRDEETREWVIVLNPKLQALFAPDQFTQVDWTIRRSLSGQPLAQWLHGFYSSHAKPYPIKVETLHRLCGSENGSLRDFRRELQESLKELERAAGWRWRIDDADLVHIEHAPSTSQKRHIIKRTVKKGARDSTRAGRG